MIYYVARHLPHQNPCEGKDVLHGDRIDMGAISGRFEYLATAQCPEFVQVSGAAVHRLVWSLIYIYIYIYILCI